MPKREYRVEYSTSWTAGRSWSTEKYVVRDPNGEAIGFSKTLWGAKRVIQKHKKTIGRPSGIVLRIPAVEGDVDA